MDGHKDDGEMTMTTDRCATCGRRIRPFKRLPPTPLAAVTFRLGLYQRQVGVALGISRIRAMQLVHGTALHQQRYREAAATLLGLSVAELLELEAMEATVDGDKPQADDA